MILTIQQLEAQSQYGKTAMASTCQLPCPKCQIARAPGSVTCDNIFSNDTLRYKSIPKVHLREAILCVRSDKKMSVVGQVFLMIWEVETEWNNETKEYRRLAAGLTEVPDDIPAEAVRVELYKNQIEVIKGNSFSHLNRCEALGLASNKIHTIEIGAWNGLSSLKRLLLGGNEIDMLWQGMFSGLDSCTLLSLSSNKIHTIQRGMFSDGFSKVKTVQLGYNQIEELSQGIFLGLNACTQLWLYSSNIRKIQHRAMEGLNPDYILLDLRDNELSTLPWTVFGKGHPSRLTLDLSGNPLVCNRSLCWIKQGEGWIHHLHKPECNNTNLDWDDITLSCSHLGMYEIHLKYVLSKITIQNRFPFYRVIRE